MMALTESSPVSLKTLMASALVHLVYSTTILMLSGVSPSSFRSSAVVSTLAAVSADGASTLASSAPSGVTGFLNWLISFCPVWRPSMLGFPKMMQEFSFPGVFQTSGSSMLMTKAFPFLMVTLLIPVTGLSPILVIAFLNFFSPLLDLGSRSSPSCSCSWSWSSWCSWSWLQFYPWTWGCSCLTYSAITQIKIYQILNIDQQLRLMTSEQQYYEAKVFLAAYNDALRTLDQIAANRATIDKYKAYERYLLLSNQKGEIHIEGNHIRPGTYFNESKIRQLGQFSKNLFSTKLANFDTIRTYGDLAKALQSYL